MIAEHPANDPKLKAIVGERPSADYLWCGECIRWEHGRNTRNHQPALARWAALLNALGRFCGRIARWFDERAVYAQAAHLVRTGQRVGDPPGQREGLDR